MGNIQIKKISRKVSIGKVGEERQLVEKTYGRIIYRGTLRLTDMVEHIMKHGSIYTEDVVIGVITKLKTCIQEMLADGYKVKLDGIGTLYPVLTSEGVDDAKDFSAQENITRVGVAFLADQSKKSIYKASAMRQDTTLSTQLYNELMETEEESNGPSTGSGTGTGNGSGTGSGNGSGNDGPSTGSGTGTGSGTLTAPVISGTTPFEESTQVSITGPEDARVYYTTNGSTPSAESTLYTEPFTLNATTTVKAIAIKDESSSSVTTKTFTKSNGGSGGNGGDGGDDPFAG